MLKFKSEILDDSNSGLYALLALLAIPIAAIVVFIIYKMKTKQPVSYPVVATEPAYPSTYYPATDYPVMNTPVY